MLSVDEVNSIDDWRFTNRVATRSEAIRRLCQIGMAFDAKSAELSEASEEGINILSHWFGRIGELQNERDYERLTTIYEEALVRYQNLTDAIFLPLITLRSIVDEMGSRQDLSAAIAEAKEAAAQIERQMAGWRERRDGLLEDDNHRGKAEND